MLFRAIEKLINAVPGYPKSLKQSFDNPTQVDRLEDTSKIATEFPAYCQSRADTRRVVIVTFLLAAFFCLLRTIPEFVIPTPLAHDIFSLFAGIAATTASICIIGKPSKLWHWLLYLMLPLFFLYLLYVRSLFVLLAVAAFFTAIAADRFTKLTLYLGTTTPFPRTRAAKIRKAWTHRLFSLSTIVGMEFYGLLILVLLLTPFTLDWLATKAAPHGGSHRIAALLTTLGILLLLPLALELTASLLYGRRPLNVFYGFKAFSRSFLDWHTYNNQDSSFPGVLQSPVGRARTRRRLLVALVYLWSAAFVPLLSARNWTNEKLAAPPVEKNHDQYDASKSAAAKVKEDLEDAAAIELWSGDLTLAPSAVSRLEPFQQRMLTQMPQEGRAEYVRKALNLPLNSDFGLISTEPNREPVANSKREPSSFYLFSKITHPSRPEVTAFGSGLDSRMGFVFTGTIAFIGLELLLMLLVTFSFPLAFFYVASVRTATYLRNQLEAHPDTILSFGNWNQLVDELTSSDDDTENTSLLLGTNAKDGAPVLIPRQVFEEHAHILGDSGSGKTSLGVSLILNQLIKQPDCSIVVIDLKGDDTALFTGTKQDAQAAEKPFRWFTNELGRSSYAFNPLNQAYFSGLSLYQKTDVITAALGLQYGTDYGRGYYSDANADYLYRTLQAHPHIRSFKELAQILPSGIGVPHAAEVRKTATHLISVAQRLAATETLNVIDSDDYSKQILEKQIEFSDLFKTPQVVYLQLPSSLGTTSSAEIARIALYSLIGSARLTPDSERKQVFVFIDEFQRIVANNLELLMQTARSMKIGLILANQSIFDLKKPGVDLMPTVRTNTRYKQVFAASNVEDLRELIEVSGEALIHQKSYSGNLGIAPGLGGGIFSMNRSETTTPRLRTNDILLATDSPEQSIVQIRRGAGYAQFGGMPFVMRSTFHISPDEYKTRKEQLWPEKTPETLIGTEMPMQSPIDMFPPVAPDASPQPNPNSSEGVDEIFQESKKRLAKRKKKSKQQSQSNSPDKGSTS